MAELKTANLTLSGLNTFLGSKTQKILGHNTLVYKEGESIKVQYHDTVIVTFEGSKIIFSNGGFFTSTTKKRLNQFMPYGYRIFQESGLWKVWNYLTRETIGNFSGKAIFDTDSGLWEGLQTSGIERSNTLKSIKAYCKAYMAELIEGKISKPDSGDCWYCFMTFPDSFDHIANHIEEKYYVPSLLVKAIKYQDKTSIIAKQTIQMLWEGKREDIPGVFLDVLQEQGYKTLYNYCVHCYDTDK